MTVETASFISQLDATLPASGDPKSEGDNHLRLVKSVLKGQFPNFGTNAVTPTAAEVNYLGGVTSAIQTQIDGKGAIAGQTWTGSHNFTGASVTVPTLSPGANGNAAASVDFVNALSFASALPAQTGNAGKFVTTNGAAASWTDALVATSLNGGPLAGMRNRVINGRMEISQRGSSFSSGIATLTYTLDRWIVAANGAALSVAQSSQTSLPYNFMTITGAASNTSWSIRQRIESRNIRDLVGVVVTLSFYLYNTTGNASNATVSILSANAVDNFATTTLVASQAVNLSTTTQQKFTLTLNAACANGIEILFNSGSSFTSGIMVLHTVQLESGSVATQFENRPYGVELALCQRYLPAITGGDTTMVGMAAAKSSTITYVVCPFLVEARTRPTGVTASGSNIVTFETGASSLVSSAISATAAQSTKLGLLSITVSGATAGDAGIAYFNGNAGSNGSILFTGCEL